ncbi:MAG: acyltransferase family protein [Halobacteriota archaeon]
MSEPGHKRKRLLELDIIRALATSLILISHLTYYLHTNSLWWGHVLITYLTLFGLGAFFFLSGFVLGYRDRNFNTWSDVMIFYKKRLIRIYPLYLAALTVAVSAFILFPRLHFSLSASQALVYALGLQGLLGPNYAPDFYMFWFVGVILLCYLIYPLMMRYGSNSKAKLLSISAAIFVLFLSMRLFFGIVDVRFFLYYFVFVSGIIVSIFDIKKLGKRNTYVGATLLLFLLMTTHSALYHYQLPDNQSYASIAEQFSPYAYFALFLILNAMMLLFIPLLYCFANYLSSLTTLIPAILLVSYASYAIFLFSPLILAGVHTVFTGMHAFTGPLGVILLIIFGVSVSCLLGYSLQRAADRTIKKVAQ